MNSGTGKYLAGCGCLLWLGCFVFSLFVMFGYSFFVAATGVDVPGIGFANYGSMCCSAFGFFLFLAGVVVALVGSKPEVD